MFGDFFRGERTSSLSVSRSVYSSHQTDSHLQLHVHDEWIKTKVDTSGPVQYLHGRGNG
jgi:hypothetical protein